MQAISAVDVALWDLKARLLGVPVARLLGQCRDAVPVYGSGGFTSMSEDELGTQVDAPGGLLGNEDQDRRGLGQLRRA